MQKLAEAIKFSIVTPSSDPLLDPSEILNAILRLAHHLSPGVESHEQLIERETSRLEDC